LSETSTPAVLPPEGEPRRVRLAMGAAMFLCVIGIGIALDLTHVYTLSRTDPDYQSFCAVSEGMNCETVALSRWSAVGSVPNSIWAIAGYAFALLLTGITTFRRDRGPGVGLVVLLAIAMAMVSLWLLFVMHFLIGSFCILCLALDVVNLGILVLAVVAARARDGGAWRAVRCDVAMLFRRPALLVALGVAGIGALALAGTWSGRYLAAHGIAGGVGPRSHEVGPSPHPGAWAGAAKAGADPQCGPEPAAAVAPRFGVSPDGHPWVGGEHPRLEIQEFTDYQCPHCRRAHLMVRKLVGTDPRIRVYHRHLPLDMACNPSIQKPFHAHAGELPRAAVCAGRQGRFWEMNDFLFQQADEIREKNLGGEDIARRLELDMEAFRCCMADPEATAIVDADVAEANRLGLRGTPAFVIDGQVHYGKIPEEVLSRLDAADPAEP